MRRLGNEKGTTLVETIIASLVALVGVFSLGGLLFQATVTSKNEGTEVTRATIYAQDKLEKLLSLNMNAGPPDPGGCNPAGGSQNASCNTTGITDASWIQGLQAGGEISPLQLTCPSTGPSVGYVDYLDSNGIQITGPCGTVAGTTPAYVRQWQITDITPNGAPSTGAPAVKNITVAVYAQAAVNTGIAKPIVVLTSVLSNPN
jgi:hypothetical protein